MDLKAMYDIQYALQAVLELIEPVTSAKPDTMKKGVYHNTPAHSYC